jgi:hypothetical protein
MLARCVCIVDDPSVGASAVQLLVNSPSRSTIMPYNFSGIF